MEYASINISRTTETLPPFRISCDCLRHKGGTHFHDFTQICHMLSGTLKHTIQKKEYPQTHGTAAIVFPFTRHITDSLSSEDTPIAAFISFSNNFLIEHGYRYFSNNSDYAYFEGKKLPVFRNFSDEESVAADKIVRDLLDEFSLKRAMSFRRMAEGIASYLKICATEPIKETDLIADSERINAIFAATDYIGKHFFEKISINKLCSVAAMSRSSFTYTFKLVTGMTVAQFINSVRIHEARRLIAFSNKSFVDIASAVGFYDGAHLTNAFTDHYGVSPTQFREKSQKDAKLLELHFSYYRRINRMKGEEHTQTKSR